MRDLRHGVRRLVRDRVFTLTVLATLGACLAANAFVFSIVYSVLLNPLPIEASDRIVTSYKSYPNVGAERAANGATDYYDRLGALDDLFEEQALYGELGMTLGDPAPPQRIEALEVTPSFFRLLRVTPRLGRAFTDDEGEPGNDDKVILSDALWRQSFGGRPGVLGQRLQLNGVSYTIVGVMGPEFHFVHPDTRLWVPLTFTPEERGDDRRHSNNNYENIGRLRPGATLEQVRERLEALTAANLDRFPQMREPLEAAGFHVRSQLLQDELVRQVRPTLLLLWGGVLFVLAIGCVNLANLVLSRTSTQTRELGTRFALGASLGHVARQQLIEGVMLGTASGAVGIGIGWAFLQAAGPLGIDQLPRGSEIALSLPAAVIILASGLLIGLLLGVIPLAQAAGIQLGGVFRDQARLTTGSRAARRLRAALVVAQVGIAFTLLLGAGLLLTSFREVLRIDPGFRAPHGILSAQVSPPFSRYPDRSAIRSFCRELLRELQALPSVERAALASSVPFTGNFSDSVLIPEGYELRPDESVISPSIVAISPDYFETMGIPLLKGRPFDTTDSAQNPATIILDERLARRFWENDDPIGRRVFFPASPEDLVNPSGERSFLTVVGVVGAVKERGLVDVDERFGTAYQPLEQAPRWGLIAVLRTALDPAALIGPVRETVARLDRELPVYNTLALGERIDRSLQGHRTPLVMASAFALLALFLSAVGLYGVLAYQVARRTNEIGIRMALGGDRVTIFGLVLRQGVLLVGAGLFIGLAGVVGLNRLISGLLYGVRPLEPTVVVAVAVVMAVVGLGACLAPARRASSVDPVQALND